VDSTTLEANAAMKSIVRRDTGEDWKAYVTRLMREQGVIGPGDEPSAEDVRRFDRKRKDKTASNADWESETDGDAKIARMKDGTTHLAYKAEHVVDLASDLVLAAEVRPADHADTAMLADSLAAAQINLAAAGSVAAIEEVVADKGYHAAAAIELCDFLDVRTYIPEPKLPQPATWPDKPEEQRRAAVNNRRRMGRAKGKGLQRRRSEVVERTFAHVCETGGSRRTHLRGRANVAKRYLIAAAAHNLGRILWRLTGTGKPKARKGAASLAGLASLLWARLRSRWARFASGLARTPAAVRRLENRSPLRLAVWIPAQNGHTSTGC
jgi:hypothetical protein